MTVILLIVYTYHITVNRWVAVTQLKLKAKGPLHCVTEPWQTVCDFYGIKLILKQRAMTNLYMFVLIFF